ncbi:MAG: hypothetical protein IJ587_06530 [Synergistaceae bacterium]|nr:hypothetical protein [Synergistaceae bacterium]
MIKRIKDLTLEEKARHFENVNKAMLREQGVPWSRIEPKIRASIDETFDDEAFSKMDTEFAIDAAYARNHFKWHEKHEKPSVVDYLLYMGEFVTHSDLVEISDESAQPAEEATASSSVSTTSKNKPTGKKTQSAKKPKTERKKPQLSGIDKIRLIADWAEKTMMPPPGSPWAEINKLKDRLFAAT